MVATDAGLRVARHADATGRFPRFSDDEVHQWLAEEALLVRLRVWERRLEDEAMVKGRVEEAERRVADELAQRRKARAAGL